MVEFNKKLQDLAKQKGAYKLYLKKEMKMKGLKWQKIINPHLYLQIPLMIFLVFF